MLIAFISSFLSFALLPLILMKDDLDEIRIKREKEDEEELGLRKQRREDRRKRREEFKNAAAGSAMDNEGGDTEPLMG